MSPESLPENCPAPKTIGVIFRVTLVYLGLNVIALAVAKLFSLERPLFNLDYLLAGLVFVWVSRSLAALLLLALLVVEFVRNWIPTYFFSKQAFSVIFWARSMSHWPPLILLTVLMVVLLTATGLVVLFRRHKLLLREKLAATATLFCLGLAVILADTLNGSNSIWTRSKNVFDVNISSSPLRLVSRQTWNMYSGKPATFAPLAPGHSATELYFSGIGALPALTGLPPSPAMIATNFLPEKIVIVVVESFSVRAADTNLAQWLQLFSPLTNRFELVSGSFEWAGATLRGEIRELCWQAVDGTQLLGNTPGRSLPAALPAALKNAGYATTAFHGFYQTMYDRGKVYPMLGFDRTHFLNEMEKNGAPLTGTLFRGAQDSYVAGLVHEEILRPGRRLVYWMTLNSHVPVNVPFAKTLATPEELRQFTALPAPVWGHAVILRKTLESIEQIAADPAAAGCDFVVVGDHSIPLTDKELKSFYEPNRVPYLILRHKNPAAP
jgi:hypothetical protein